MTVCISLFWPRPECQRPTRIVVLWMHGCITEWSGGMHITYFQIPWTDWARITEICDLSNNIPPLKWLWKNCQMTAANTCKRSERSEPLIWCFVYFAHWQKLMDLVVMQIREFILFHFIAIRLHKQSVFTYGIRCCKLNQVHVQWTVSAKNVENVRATITTINKP